MLHISHLPVPVRLTRHSKPSADGEVDGVSKNVWNSRRRKRRGPISKNEKNPEAEGGALTEPNVAPVTLGKLAQPATSLVIQLAYAQLRHR